MVELSHYILAWKLCTTMSATDVVRYVAGGAASELGK
jgi:hypothetical protein